jgi:hypothetical protein
MHDLIFAVGGFALFAGMIPAVYRGSVLPLPTTAMTALILLTYTINYATMGFVWSTVCCALQVVSWLILLFYSWRNHARSRT